MSRRDTNGAAGRGRCYRKPDSDSRWRRLRCAWPCHPHRAGPVPKRLLRRGSITHEHQHHRDGGVAAAATARRLYRARIPLKRTRETCAVRLHAVLYCKVPARPRSWPIAFRIEDFQYPYVIILFLTEGNLSFEIATTCVSAATDI